MMELLLKKNLPLKRNKFWKYKELKNEETFKNGRLQEIT